MQYSCPGSRDLNRRGKGLNSLQYMVCIAPDNYQLTRNGRSVSKPLTYAYIC
jgi:hypothetical protein